MNKSLIYRSCWSSVALLCVSATARADSIYDGISDAGNAIYGYLPFVQSLGYTLTCIIGLLGAFVIFYRIQNADRNIKKSILAWGGSALAMLCMTIAHPEFFGYEGSGSGSGGGMEGVSGDGSLAGGDTYGKIDTEIPGLTDTRWTYDSRYTLVSVNGQTITANEYLTKVYDYCGGGSNGSYERTFEFLESAYNRNVYDYSTYQYLVESCGFLPHN